VPTPYSAFGHGARDDAADLLALLGVERGEGPSSQISDAALQRAIALAKMNGPALAVAEHLDFDMARFAKYFSR